MDARHQLQEMGFSGKKIDKAMGKVSNSKGDPGLFESSYAGKCDKIKSKLAEFEDRKKRCETDTTCWPRLKNNLDQVQVGGVRRQEETMRNGHDLLAPPEEQPRSSPSWRSSKTGRNDAKRTRPAGPA